MLWLAQSLVAAFGQASSMAFKKKALEDDKYDIPLGFVSYFVAFVALVFIWVQYDDSYVPAVQADYYAWLSLLVFLNILAQFCKFKALGLGSYTKLSAFLPVTALGIIPVELVLLGVLPNWYQGGGVVLIVIGGLLFGWKQITKQVKMQPKDVCASKWYTVTLVAYTITAPLMAMVMVKSAVPYTPGMELSGLSVVRDGMVYSPMFAGIGMHVGIATGFLFLALLTWRHQVGVIKEVYESGTWKRALLFMVLAGLSTGILENGMTYFALTSATAVEVFALKRTMPLFSWVYSKMFREQMKWYERLATAFIIAGAIIIPWFK